MNSTYNSTGIDNLIKKYQSEISAREGQIKHNQLQIEKDSDTICQLNNKIQTLKDLIVELKKADEEEATNKSKILDKTSPTKASQDYWNHPDRIAEKAWGACSEELNKFIEELNKKNKVTQLDFFGTDIWPVD